MEKRCGLDFKRKGGLGRGGLMWKGSLVNGQALSKRRSQNSQKLSWAPAGKHTQMYIHLHTQQFSLNPINQSPTLLYITYITISTSCLSHTPPLSTANQLQSQLSLSVPGHDMNEHSSPALVLKSSLRSRCLRSLLLPFTMMILRRQWAEWLFWQ